jgi:hypothetical protein
MQNCFSPLRLVLFVIALCNLQCNLLDAKSSQDNFKGTLYEKGTHRTYVLFQFQRSCEKNTCRNTFSNPSGEEAVVETINYNDDDTFKSFSVDQRQTNESGEIKVENGKVSFSWTKEGKTKTDSEKITDNFVVPPTLVPYLHKNWDALLAGKTINVRLGAADRRETVGFSLFKMEEKKLNDRDVIVVKMKATSFIIAAIVDPLFFTFDKESKRLVELVGRTSPKRKVGNSWKDLDVEIEYQYPK